MCVNLFILLKQYSFWLKFTLYNKTWTIIKTSKAKIMYGVYSDV